MTVPSSEMQVITLEPGLHYTEAFARFTDENSFHQIARRLCCLGSV
ncbi:hypothetical protein RAB80_002217 [Fusarium oxysporum f. sp. vasinfectum]|nr:hypothetical protein RAB80_002217 [Fusarium oxysporum f. sp. vasinfectum]